MGWEVNNVPVKIVGDLKSSDHDAVVLVTFPKEAGLFSALKNFVIKAAELDKDINSGTANLLSCPAVAGGRLIVTSTGPLTPYHDVRSVGEAAKRGMQRAVKAGARNPILVVQAYDEYKESELVLLLGAFEALYVPLQIRELFPDRKARLTSLGIYGDCLRHPLEKLVHNAVALEVARGVGRDIGGGDPERMAPGAVARHVRELFAGSASVSVSVVSDAALIEKEYPLFAAVNRAANSVDRHKGNIIFLEYQPPVEHKRTVLLVGKGVTYDTGGCDIKAGGVMAGMSRDKCGAAAVAAFVKACELLKAEVKVVGVMGMVRNSVGEEAYVADELIVCRAGKTVRVGNTDAEGRMIMGDLLHEMHKRSLSEVNPHIYTIATLTGHAHRAMGEGYTVVMDNHVARSEGHSASFQRHGELLADMVEVSSIRREDLRTHRGTSDGDDVLQALNQPSTACPRGHQGPAAFLLMVSNLEQGSVPYSHLDIAASGGTLPQQPTAAPVLALANLYGLIQY